MYRNSYQRGMLTVFFSVGSKPLAIWDIHTKDGYVSRFLDQDIKSMVLEIGGTNVSTTYITCPKDNKVLGISMPFLVMIVKNLKKYFSFEVTILDETGTRRRFRVSNFQSSTQILPLCTVMPIGLSEGWNQIQFNLAEFTRRAYKKQFVEVQKLKINANIRLRRIYFTERLVPEDELPAEYKLFFPLSSKAAKEKKGSQTTTNKEILKQSTSKLPIEQPQMQPKEKLESKVDIVKTSAHSITKKSSRESKKGSKTEVEAAKETLEITFQPEDAPIAYSDRDINEGQEEVTESIRKEAVIEEQRTEEAVIEEQRTEEAVMEEQRTEEAVIENKEQKSNTETT